MSTAAQSWSQRYKPAASRRTQILSAAILWTLVGIGLGIAGSIWTFGAARGVVRIALLALALSVGWAKGRFVLARTARRTLARIEERGDGRCLGGFLSWKGWLLVATMVIGGRLLRGSPLPRTILGPLYLAVGVALLTGSFTFWRAPPGSIVRACDNPND